MSEYIPGLRKQLVHELDELRLRQSMTKVDVATAMHVSSAKISRLFSGERPLDYPDIAYMLSIFHADRETTTRLLDLTVRCREKSAFARHFGPKVSDVELGFYEGLMHAPLVRDQSGGLLPYVLRRFDYEARILTVRFRDPDQIAARLDALVQVNQVVERSDAFIQVVMSEDALMRADLADLIHVQSRMERYSIRVSRFTDPLILGIISPYVLLSWADAPVQNMMLEPEVQFKPHMLQSPQLYEIGVDAWKSLEGNVSHPEEFPQILQRHLARLGG